jgi:hypothetical protein
MILDAIFDNSKSTNIANITNSTFDNKNQFYAFYASLSSFVNLFFTSFSINFLIIDRSSIDQFCWMKFTRRRSSIKTSFINNFSSFWKMLISYIERVSSSRSKRNENETKSECRMKTIDELKHSIISNWRDRESHFSITKRRIT